MLEPIPENKKVILQKIINVTKDLAHELHLNPDTLDELKSNSALDKDLGLDSLSRVELIARLERLFNVNLQDDVFSNASTPEELVQAIIKATKSLPKEFIQKPTQMLRPVEKIISPPPEIYDFVEILKWHKEKNPDRVHLNLILDSEKKIQLTYQEIYEKSLQVSSSLKQLGLLPRERVAIMLPTSTNYFLTFLGVILAGAIPVPVYPPMKLENAQKHLLRQKNIFSNCQASFLVTTREIKILSGILKSQLRELRHTVCADELLEPAISLAPVKASPSDIAFLQYTSGSTGMPKGVTLTHHNLISNIKAMINVMEITPQDVVVSWLPLYHDMGLIGTWLGSLYLGTPCIFMSPMHFLARPERWLWTIHENQGTVSAAPNFAYELCLKRVNKEDIEGLNLNSWRIAINGAEPVSSKTIKKFSEFFAPFGFSQAAFIPSYGLAENSVGLTFSPLHRGPKIISVDRNTLMKNYRVKQIPFGTKNSQEIVSCGTPLPGHQVQIVDLWDNELPEKRVGHIQFKGPSATSGYFHSLEKTKQLFHKEWLDSGDLGFMLDGELYITGRVKDIIIKAGRNISPPELEEMVGEIESVKKGGVVAFSWRDPEDGNDKLVVIAEVKDLSEKNKKAVTQKINAITIELLEVGADKIILVPPKTLLKTSSGKIMRHACKQLFESGHLMDLPSVPWGQSWTKYILLAWNLVSSYTRYGLHLVADFIYMAYAYTLFLVVACPLLLLIILFPYNFKWPIIRFGVKFFLKLALIPVKIDGLQNLASKNKNYIFVCNHCSYLDGPIVAGHLGRKLSFVAKKELFDSLFTKWLLTPLETIFIQRENPYQAVEEIKTAKYNYIKRHNSFFFFPEGTFTRIPGLAPFHMGAFLLATELNLDVVPVTIHGTRSMLKKDNFFFPRRSRVFLTIGKPIRTKEIKRLHEDNWSVAIKLKDLARAQILKNNREPDLAPKV